MDWKTHIQYYVKQTAWASALPIIPRRCYISHKWLWLRPAMRGTRLVRADMDFYTEVYWVDSHELLMYNLQYPAN